MSREALEALARNMTKGEIWSRASEDAEEEGYSVPPEAGLSRFEDEAYEAILQRIEGPLQQMRRLIEGHLAREKEREWQTFLTDGELDDGLVVDGVCGQQNVYRRRKTATDPMFVVKKPKRLMFAVDLSLSMTIFNPLDERLDRLVEACVFLFEAFHGHEEKYDYAMVGFSAAGPQAVRLVDWGRPPRSRKERVALLKGMRDHSANAKSGDATMEATELAILEAAREPADEHFAFIVSDAEVDRYGIRPEDWNEVLMKTDKRVQAYAILISMESDKVTAYRDGFEPGHGFLCEDSAALIAMFQRIFDSALFKRNE